MHFKDLQLHKPIIKALFEKNYKQPTLIQELAIPLIFEGHDLIASAQTGTGKTAAYALPIIQRLFLDPKTQKKSKKIKALIICPTRELAIQIEKSFMEYCKHTHLKTGVLFGGASIDPQKNFLKQGIDILIATPGRLLDMHKQSFVNLSYVETFVLDEADLMLDMGFVDDVKKIERLCLHEKQNLLFSATMPYKVTELAKAILNTPKKIDLTSDSSEKSSIHQTLYHTQKIHKIALCSHILKQKINSDAQVMIFRRTKYGVEKLEKTLTQQGYKVSGIHGDRSQSLRQQALNQFRNKETSILIATDVAARGIDIEHLDVVINFDIPNKVETYIHRIGRTGRAGHTGIAISICSLEEQEYIHAIERKLAHNIAIETEHPFPIPEGAKPETHKKKGSKYKKGRKSTASKKKKKRWY